jgi:hypothetical protein
MLAVKILIATLIKDINKENYRSVSYMNTDTNILNNTVVVYFINDIGEKANKCPQIGFKSGMQG